MRPEQRHGRTVLKPLLTNAGIGGNECKIVGGAAVVFSGGRLEGFLLDVVVVSAARLASLLADARK